MPTPARQQYLDLKAKYPDAILLYRLGDFYETFDEDAHTAARELHLTLTSREFGKGCRVPMAGIPHHALNGYLGRLVRKGYRVAICEQLSEPGHGLVDREVVRVVSAGTVVEPHLLHERANNYLVALLQGRNRGAAEPDWGIAWVDVTTGEFAVAQFGGPGASAAAQHELERLNPAEVLLPERAEPDFPIAAHVTQREAWRFDETAGRERLQAQLRVGTLDAFGCARLPLAIGAAGAILDYLEATNPALLPLLTDLRTASTGDGMRLDAHTRRNLELLHGGPVAREQGGPRASLIWVLDVTGTPMGSRLLRRWIAAPLLDRERIERRLDAVAELVAEAERRLEIRAELGKVGDVERLTSRVTQGIANPRELRALAACLGSADRLRDRLAEAEAPALGEIAARLAPPEGVVELIERAAARGEAGDGRLVRAGYSEALDELVRASGEGKGRIVELEAAERARTGIKSLKVGYNQVFGYYLEVTRPNLKHVPPEWSRKQSLVGAERFITAELKDWESRVLGAAERIADLERELWAGILREVGARSPRLLRTAAALAELDVYAALAEVADRQGYCRPLLEAGDRIDIVAGRHPVVEATLPAHTFIPNDCHLGGDDCQVMLLTGPNMAGKSTYLRQVALIVLMAQIGSFVPARAARIGLVDRIFTRVGAQDDIAGGRSTFMVEMAETAGIVRQATPRSLILLDEIGRGTSTYDGVAIARAVVEHLHDRLGARTLFATHYHELTRLALELPRVRNFSVAVADEGGEIAFLHRIVEGASDRSYGVHVARLAGMPASITERAERVLESLESARPPDPRRPSAISRQPSAVSYQPSAIGHAGEVMRELLALPIHNLTPMQAINKLFDLQERARNGEG